MSANQRQQSRIDGTYCAVYSLTYKASGYGFPSVPASRQDLQVAAFPSSTRFRMRDIPLKAERPYRAARSKTHRRSSLASRLSA